MTTAAALSLVCWLCAAVGLIIATSGLWYGSALATSFGGCLTAYSLTGHTYVPLTDPTHGPLSTGERTWGATAAVMGGGACIGVLIALRRRIERTEYDRPPSKEKKSKPTPKQTDWADGALGQSVLFTVFLGCISIGAIHLSLNRYTLAPSSNFLTDYGRLTGVAIYELVFAIWILIPVGGLSYTAFKTPKTGPFRWLVVIGGAVGVLWGLWKIFGVVAVRTADSHVEDESPVSVALGLSTLATCVAGVVASSAWWGFHHWRGKANYKSDRARDDRFLRRGFKSD